MVRRAISLVVISLIGAASAQAETPFDAFAKMIGSAGDSLSRLGDSQPPRRAGSGPSIVLTNVPLPNLRPGEEDALAVQEPALPPTTTAFVALPASAPPAKPTAAPFNAVAPVAPLSLLTPPPAAAPPPQPASPAPFVAASIAPVAADPAPAPALQVALPATDTDPRPAAEAAPSLPTYRPRPPVIIADPTRAGRPPIVTASLAPVETAIPAAKPAPTPVAPPATAALPATKPAAAPTAPAVTTAALPASLAPVPAAKPTVAAPAAAPAAAATTAVVPPTAAATATATPAALKPTPAPFPTPSAAPKVPAEGTTSCAIALAAFHVKVAPASGLGEGECRVAAPVTVTGIDDIAVNPKALIDCATAATLAAWLQDTIAPKAQAMLGQKLTAIRVLDGYDCRTVNNVKGANLSEHARGRAVDIGAFKVGDRWINVTFAKDLSEVDAKFLDAVRKAACGPFTTVLGPGSDPQHYNHFHVDLQQRQTAGPSKGLYCT
jgi:hypothetical protein